MNSEQLREANKLKEEIDELERFIFRAEHTWKGKLSIRKVFMIFTSHAYGALDSAEYEMDYKMKCRVLDVLRERLKELKEKLEGM